MNEARLQETWYGDREPGVLLSALEKVYQNVAAHRRSKAKPADDLLGMPIIVVGNITVGGTGKTPLVIRLCELLREEGLAAAVVSRGYGRQERGPVTVDSDTKPARGGDEPVLIAQRCGIPVYVDCDREAAARTAFDEGAEVVLADDGLQRATLPRRQEFCVVDGRRGFGNGRLLPAGPLREPLERLEQVDWVIRNGTAIPETQNDPLELAQDLRHPMITMQLEASGFWQLGDARWHEATDLPAEWSGGVTAMAGMGNPERFYHSLESLGVHIQARRSFPDHHDFGEADFRDIDGPIVMTEKDAVKCADLAPAAWALRVAARLPSDWEANWRVSVRAMTKSIFR